LLCDYVYTLFNVSNCTFRNLVSLLLLLMLL
jgi:hypothetical protein